MEVLSDRLDMQAAWLGMETPANPGIDTPAHEGDVLRAGSIEAQVLHTPGHTPGSISLYLQLENKVIAGDTLFRGSIGRTDFPGGDAGKQYDAVTRRLFALPDETVVWPGHDYGVAPSSTIGNEAATNPFLLCKNLEEFLHLKDHWAEYKKAHNIA